ncbi:hypothetical protein [Saccharospirillum mangrovi]|uniref:hypothetical protein n=1 Tax=Saccharospirillum mangrovi TaxID=2161747 RepID=UPI001300A4FD|nr:hypothetical protein [Saccharospirillum mangrovi]
MSQFKLLSLPAAVFVALLGVAGCSSMGSDDHMMDDDMKDSDMMHDDDMMKDEM